MKTSVDTAKSRIEEKKAMIAKLVDNPNAMINRKTLSWCEDDDERFKRGNDQFGPPLFDEKRSTHTWRHFKRGSLYGKYTILELNKFISA